jgi:hypothetical protein
MRGWTDGWLDIWTNVLMVGWMDVGLVDEWIVGWIDGC